MKNKINIRLFLIAFLGILLSTIGITVVFYEIFQNEVREDLKTDSMIIQEAGVDSLTSGHFLKDYKDLRVTWIDDDGKVLYDNDTDIVKLENHKDRPEIAEAFQVGSGESVRESDTMNMRTFYYAVRMDDGTVLRVSRVARSIFSVYLSAAPVLMCVIILIMLVCMILSHLLTRQLLLPIDKMAENIENPSYDSEYKELRPFVIRIREQHGEILAAAKMRQDFTANVSHELKTPLTAISGYAELIENCMVDEKMQLSFAAKIRKNADRLVSLINDIIRLSELDNSEKGTEFSQVDIFKVAEERIDILKMNASKHNISITLEGESLLILSNRDMLIELIDNLCQNAIRYNVPGGKVIVRIKKHDNKSILEIEDTGIGISKEEQTRVFERFYRVDKSRSRETGGTGLGLAIVKHIVEIHDGVIKLDSIVNKGTKITIEF